MPLERTDDAYRCPPLVVLADDLSGAVECAAALPRCQSVYLDPGTPGPAGATRVLDLDSRRGSAPAAARIVARAVRVHETDGALLVKKADSTLRGHFAPEAAAFADRAGGILVVPALPALGRTVRDGVVRLHGVPLHLTGAWKAEPEAPPRSVGEALGTLRTAVVPLEEVRAGAPHLERRLRSGLAAGTSLVCDAETDADLDALAAVLLRLPRTVRTIGSGGIVGALGRRSVAGCGRSDPGPPEPGVPRRVVVVVGTAHPGAAAQIAQLTARGAQHIALSADALLAHPSGEEQAAPDAEDLTRARTAPDARAPLRHTGAGTVRRRFPVTVFSIDSTGTIDASAAPRLVHALCRTVVGRLPEDADLVLTGGETARTFLNALAVTTLLPVREVHHGAVLCRTPAGRGVVTRPGSFGGPDSLVRMVEALRPDTTRHTHGGTTDPIAAGIHTPSDGGP
ncbi:four-carbon acid sugar kinase family protein [Streptomyces sp. NPDC047973]|uniref:four-carbon acid sugar kinase family protein n=1 Tax=Streptomyces sp. NPDC047973 TaxID=3155383 RepID=UPI0034383E0B